MPSIKRERFVRVAAPRVQKVLDSMESLSKCSHKGNYEYDSGDIKKMISVIKNQLKNLEHMFAGGANAAGKRFSFDNNKNEE